MSIDKHPDTPSKHAQLMLFKSCCIGYCCDGIGHSNEQSVELVYVGMHMTDGGF